MAISMRQFRAAQAAAEDHLRERIAGLLTQSDQAHTAREITAQLVSATDPYKTPFTNRIDETLPLVEACLQRLVGEGRIACAPVEIHWLGWLMYYARRPPKQLGTDTALTRCWASRCAGSTCEAPPAGA